MRRSTSLTLLVVMVLLATGAFVPAGHATTSPSSRLVVFEAFMRST